MHGLKRHLDPRLALPYRLGRRAHVNRCNGDGWGSRRVALAAVFAGFALPAKAIAAFQSPATGGIEGTATISSQLTSLHQRVRVYDEPGAAVSGPPEVTNAFANVVFYLETTPALKADAAPHALLAPAMRQRGERFEPHVLPVLTGTTVDFPNEDPLYHNVFSLSRAREFDLGRYPRGASKQLSFRAAGVVQVFCHIHADMSGYILVLDNPFFVIPDAQGHFSLGGIPPGDYRLVAWHERIRPLVTPVHVESGRTTTLAVRIPLPDAPVAR